jgi:ribosomal protein S18 acetylase RimI-like enzyme
MSGSATGSGSHVLYERSVATVIASWDAVARGGREAIVRRLPGVHAAVFPHEPERSVYNNAYLALGLSNDGDRRAIDAAESVYAALGITSFALWAHETDAGVRDTLEARGYGVAECTRAMGVHLSRAANDEAAVDVETGTWSDYLAFLEQWDVPPGLLAGVDEHAFRVRLVRNGGRPVAASIAFDHDGDCGIFNVGTLEDARGRGYGTAVTAAQLRDGRVRGCVTATLQSTQMAERIYTGLGFQDLGRILEYRTGASSR